LHAFEETLFSESIFFITFGFCRKITTNKRFLVQKRKLAFETFEIAEL